VGIMALTRHNLDSVLKEIVFMAHHLGLIVNFTPISHPDYERWVAEQTKPRFTVTLLCRQLHAQYLAIVSKILFDNNLNIDSITRLSGRVSLSGKRAKDSKSSRSALQFEVACERARGCGCGEKAGCEI
jgi:phosphoserine phosphatase